MHPATAAILRHFRYEHLPEPMGSVSKQFHDLAHTMVRRWEDATGAAEVHSDSGAELTAGLRKLLEAKDCIVRAFLPPGK